MEYVNIALDLAAAVLCIGIAANIWRLRDKVFELVKDLDMRFFAQIELVRDFVIERLSKQETRTKLACMIAEATCETLCEYLDRMTDDGR